MVVHCGRTRDGMFYQRTAATELTLMAGGYPEWTATARAN